MTIRKGQRTHYGSALGAKITVELAVSVCGGYCWRWLGKLDKDGYGHVRVGKRIERAHRVVYERCRGEGSAGGKDLHHKCGNSWCVNPRHLRPEVHEYHGSISNHILQRGGGWYD